MKTRVAWAALAGVVVVALGACGQSEIQPQAAARQVQQLVFRQTGFLARDVHCPSGVAARVGGTYDCHFTGPEGPYVAHVRILAVHGQRVEQAIDSVPVSASELHRVVNARATEALVASFVARHTGFRPGDVSCPVGVRAVAGARLDCHFTGPDGRYVAHVRIARVRGSQAVDQISTRRVG